MTAAFVGTFFVFVLGIPPVLAQTLDPAAVDGLPRSVHLVDGGLRGRLLDMLEKSATFRRQCRAIAREPQLQIRVSTMPWLGDTQFRARSIFRRFSSGLLEAEVELTSGDPTEWLAHEFEHVIEQIEHEPLRWLADRGEQVWRSGYDSYETTRAIRAGQTVRQEVREWNRLTRAASIPDRER
jgi:hypothetical protein